MIQPLDHQPEGSEADQHLNGSRRRQCGQSSVRNRIGQADVDVLAKRRRDLVLKELSETAMLRIEAAQQFTLVKTERDRVIALSRARFPCGLLTREHDRETVQIGNHVAIDRLIEGEETGLVREELTDG